MRHIATALTVLVLVAAAAATVAAKVLGAEAPMVVAATVGALAWGRLVLAWALRRSGWYEA